MRRPVLLLALGVSLLAILAVPPAASGAPRPVRALVLREATSPVLGELRAQLGANLQVDRATSRRLRQSRRYRLLIVDGDALSPAELARRRRAIDRYMDRRGWVLGLDIRRGHFARAIDRLTRVSVRPATGGHSARVFLFRHARVGRVPATVTLRAARLNPLGSAQLSPSGREEALADNTARIAAMVRARLLRPRTGLPPAPSVRLTSGDDGIPAEALHKLWPHTEANAGVVPKPAYFSSNPPPSGVTPPSPGSQTVTWTMNHVFDAYLDNSPSHPDGNFQVVTYNLDGHLAPKKPNEKFQYMDDTFRVGLSDLNLERAWWTGLVDVSVTPDAATDEKLTWQANAPATPNEETTYTSGQEFEVGISATEEGPAVSASYTVNNESEHTVPDWGVVSDSSGNTLDWEFSARNACDVRTTSPPSACAAGATLLPVRPNELSLGDLSIATSGRWRTKEPLEPGNGTLNFKLATPVTLADTVCPFYGVGACDQRWGIYVDKLQTGPPDINYTLDASDVVPVGLKPLTLSPNPADGASNQPVTGTVTLERNAPVQTNIKVFSDDPNATLPLPVQGAPGVTQDSVTIPEGESSATFRINTNNNDLPKGATETADITAFYTDPTIAQLRVKG
jgi:hypothetical protein